MAHKCVPISYAPKADAVFDGECRQTIRMGRRYQAGDAVTFYEWTGKPYRSKWGRRKTVTLHAVLPVVLAPAGIYYTVRFGACLIEGWDEGPADELAARDGIDPPKGTELRRVLEQFSGPLPDEGAPAQILRW